MVKGKANSIHPRALQEIIEAVEGKPEEMVVSTVMLRSMQQAKYHEDSLGHFGLSTEFYTHFTSPIRRYPDLIVHRLIRTYLIEGDLSKETRDKWKILLPDIAEHTSKRERRAVDAERETDDLKKTEFMLDKVGEEYDGIISSVTNFGMFVELENTIEGLVHVSAMNDDYYRFDERHLAMIGGRTAKVFRIGDEVRVKVINVDKDERAIDFEIAGMKNTRRRENTEMRVFKAGGDRKGKGNATSSNGNGGDRSRRKPKASKSGGNGKGRASSKGKKKFFENAPKSKRKNKR